MAKKKRGLKTWIAIALAFVVGFSLAFLIDGFFLDRGPDVSKTGPYTNYDDGAPQKPVEGQGAPEQGLPSGEVSKEGARLAIVIDDLGADLRIVDELAKSGAPITIAVMPGERRSSQAANRAHELGLEVILHMPMEPHEGTEKDPGRFALLTSMGQDKIRRLFLQGLSQVPHAVGVNNHMGSKFTEDPSRMKVVLETMRELDLYFLDSRTSSKSKGADVAKSLGLKTAQRDVFLDNERDEAYIRSRFEEAAQLAKRQGSAIVIGHPYPETVGLVKEMVSRLREKGVEVVALSELVE